MCWAFRFGNEAYTLRFDGERWQLGAGDNAHADVIVDTTPRDRARVVMSADDEPADTAPPMLTGTRRRVREFETMFGSRGSGSMGRP